MSTFTFTWLHVAAVLTLATHTVAQQCYYPNGSPAPDTEKPCSSAQGSACCPDTWQCLDNGLCYLPTGKLYGRYSCTDKNWKSPGCASNMCTYNGQAGGGEAITQCANHNNDWCCNADATNVNCCQESPSPRPFFQLQDGKAYATIGRNQASSAPTLASFTGLASGSGSGSSPSRTSAPSSSARPASSDASTISSKEPATPASSASPVTSIAKSVTSGSAGVVTVERTIITTPTVSAVGAGSNGSSDNSSGPNIGLIVGCAVGIPMALALFGIIFWMLRKRRQQKGNPYQGSPDIDDATKSSGFAGGAAASLGKKETYRHSRPGTTEIDSHPTGFMRPVSTIPGHAELDSGGGFQPGHGAAYAPDTVGIGGGNGDGQSTWASAPPGYSPGGNQVPFNGASELDDTSVMPAINEKPGPPQQQYQAYHSPAAELPTVNTPREDVEKQIHR
ncbi:hypothetical protein GQ44DRAFT_657194 [Phaeosphaeriaceae sp. PMI808]|nr:hypothetical protein GQ44DRAFT_657194 [Phaeosphaeriaceae sp. PMI808]